MRLSCSTYCEILYFAINITYATALDAARDDWESRERDKVSQYARERPTWLSILFAASVSQAPVSEDQGGVGRAVSSSNLRKLSDLTIGRYASTYNVTPTSTCSFPCRNY